MRRHLAYLLALAFVAAACGDAPLESDTTLAASTTLPSGLRGLELAPDARLALAAETVSDLDSFRYRVLIDGEADEEVTGFSAITVEAAGAVDVAEDASEVRIEYGPQLFAQLGLGDSPTFTEEIRVGGVLYSRGYSLATALVNDPDYDTWYSGLDGGFGAETALVGLVQGDELAALFAAAEAVQELGPESIGGTTTTRLRAPISRDRLQEVAEQYPDSIADLGIDAAGPPIVFDVWVDDDGNPRRMVLELEEPVVGILSYSVTIELSDFGAPLDIVAPPDAVAAPPSLSTLLADTPTSIRPQEDGTMYRLNLWRDGSELQLTVEESGRVVAVTDTSVLATPANFTTWQISRAAVDRLGEVIEDSGLLDHPRANLQFGPDTDGLENSAAVFYNDCCVLEMDGLGRRDGFTEEEMGSRLAFEGMIDKLSDLSWLGDQVLTDPAPFVPDGLTVLAEESSRYRPSIEAWPLQNTIEELAQESTNEPGWSGLSVCVYGEEVALVFALLDTQTVGITVDDGTGLWDLNIRPHLPGYQLYGDPCEAAAERRTG